MKSFISLAILLALAASSVYLLQNRSINGTEVVSDSFMEDVRIINKESGKHRWTLSAKKVLIPPDGRLSKLSDITIDLPEQGMTVESESGLYDLETRNLTLSGNIVASTDDYTIKTDSIYIETESGELSSPDKVVLEGERFRIEGDGFEANRGKTVNFKDNVKASFF